MGCLNTETSEEELVTAWMMVNVDLAFRSAQ